MPHPSLNRQKLVDASKITARNESDHLGKDEGTS